MSLYEQWLHSGDMHDKSAIELFAHGDGTRQVEVSILSPFENLPLGTVDGLPPENVVDEQQRPQLAFEEEVIYQWATILGVNLKVESQIALGKVEHVFHALLKASLTAFGAFGGFPQGDYWGCKPSEPGVQTVALKVGTVQNSCRTSSFTVSRAQDSDVRHMGGFTIAGQIAGGIFGRFLFLGYVDLEMICADPDKLIGNDLNEYRTELYSATFDALRKAIRT